MAHLASRLALALSSSTLAPTAAARTFAQAPAPPAPSAASGAPRIAPLVLDRAAVRAKLLANRRANLARFHGYRLAGVYPSNVYSTSLANVWRDQPGHYCAAATIIRASGALELVNSIAETDNAFRIADVTQGPVMDWILTSGLTQAELVLIQRPFRPVAIAPEAEPQHVVAIDPTLRAAETRRLAKRYREIERTLVRQQRASLEAAVDRLMQHPHLARRLLAARA